MASKATLEKAIIALVGMEALDELDELVGYPDINTWATHWLDKVSSYTSKATNKK